MSVIRRGKRLANGTTVLKTSVVGGQRQLRCPSCHSMAAPTKDQNGRAVFQCSKAACRLVFSAAAM